LEILLLKEIPPLFFLLYKTLLLFWIGNDHIIWNIFSLIPASSTWKAKKVNRSVNFYAHYVAYRAAVGASSNCIPSLSSPPPPFPFVAEKIHPPLLLPSEVVVCCFAALWNEVLVTKNK
jgi:hypothetical protein